MSAILLLASTAVVVWVLGAFVFVYFWPRITVGGFKRIFVRRGLGGPIPVNTLFAVPGSRSSIGALVPC
ncbi:hypothetical protein [Homoserinimonas sp. OAct 916]|uniref:hypothetical protein n=1 Tax=Homoserinimonas sp. OAct 916 TaxID=2211450 RepID=UPI000DBEA3CA|nr:hypothetical protein [Homoserinimonas sp. OAct 916]